MKKTFLTSLILIILMSTSSFAQLFFGLQGGANISSLSGTDLNSLKSKIGYHGGIVFNTGMMAKHFSLMASALYSNRGFKYEYDTTFTYATPIVTGDTITSTVKETVDVNATLGYLDIPVMITFFTNETGGFFIQAGPQFSFLITDKTQINSSAVVSTDGSQPSPTNPTTKSAVSFNKSDIAAIGGIGYKFEKILLIYARASAGFLKTQKNGFISDSNSGYNITYQAGIALVFQ